MSRKCRRTTSRYWNIDTIRLLEDALGIALAVPLMKRGLRLAGTYIPSILHTSAIHYARLRRTATAVEELDAFSVLPL